MILLLGWSVFASAHPTDVSYLRVKVEREHLEMRFTFNLAMLSRFAVLDRDGDQQLAITELTTAQPEVLLYLQEKVRAKINGQPATLGSEMVLEPLWPEAKTGKLVPTRDFPDAACRSDLHAKGAATFGLTGPAFQHLDRNGPRRWRRLMSRVISSCRCLSVRRSRIISMTPASRWSRSLLRSRQILRLGLL